MCLWCTLSLCAYFLLIRYSLSSGGTETEIFEHHWKVVEFKTVGRRVFGKFEASELGTQKWHFLDYPANSANTIMQVNGVIHLNEGVNK